ncbi:MAG: metallopeptidase family protein [Salaquimonas sp.]|jgi:predicted Zn-dependent protease with MMP-like domain|nr:metallopeptidase family protein [Salaquimonas sp.]
MAFEDTTAQWRNRVSPSLDDFEALARDAYAHLPDGFRRLTGDIMIIVADFPDDEALDELNLESPFDLLGLFEGRGIGGKVHPFTGELANRISLYRRPILDYWADHDDTLGEIVTHVLIHEIGHHFGLSDDDMARIEAGAERA